MGCLILRIVSLWNRVSVAQHSFHSEAKGAAVKCSVDALLYHGIDQDMGPKSRLETIPEMDRRASRARVRLSKKWGQRQLLETYVS